MINPIFFKIFRYIKCTAEFPPRYIFYAFFSQICAKIFHFIVFFVVTYLSHLMHSVGAIFIMSYSECAPELLSA